MGRINAKVPSTGEGAPNIAGGRPLPPPLSVGLEMLRGLLLDQFELKTHTESRGSDRIRANAQGREAKNDAGRRFRASGCKPDPNAPKPFTNIQTMIACKNTTMAELAQNLQQQANAYIDHPIVDATGLQGGWDFLIGWTPRAALQTPQSPNPDQPRPAAEAAAPSGISAFERSKRNPG